MTPIPDGNAEAKRAWDSNALFWDARMGEGNDFFSTLVWPVASRLLDPRPGERILDAACGNGLAARRLAKAGVEVVAFDFSEELVGIARERSRSLPIEYRELDATDWAGLLALGEGSFDAALCNMALMDVADVRPLFEALPRLLKAGGRFVFSVLHPCFNNSAAVQGGELEDRAGTLLTTYWVRVSRYLTPFTQKGLAMPGQPVPHPYFHRPLSALLGEGFRAGLVADALEEPSFPPENVSGSIPFSWNGRFHEIPPALVVRMRPGGTFQKVQH
jgi:SAM-dependent methyltransferase